MIPSGRKSRPSGALNGGTAAEDGFIYLAEVQRLNMPSGAVAMHGTDDGGMLDGWLFAPEGTTATVAAAPAPPGKHGTRPLVLVRHTAAAGQYISVWSWRNAINSVEREENSLIVRRRDGTVERHVRTASGWQVASEQSTGVEQIQLQSAPSEEEPLSSSRRRSGT